MADREKPCRLLALTLCLALLAGCGAETAQQEPPAAGNDQAQQEASTPSEPPEEPGQPEAESPAGTPVDTLPDVLPLEFLFCSGAGAWRTVLTLDQDGSFTGAYTDADMTTVYICTFGGQFGDFRQINDHTWAMTLEEITIQETPAAEWTEGDIHYIASDPYGIEAGTAFLLYAPETPTEGLSEDFLTWWPDWAVEDNGTLDCWSILNQEMGYGFFVYPL